MNAPPPFSHPSFQGRIGVAREDITPPVGIYARNWGAAAHDVAEGVHRPLTVTALTLQTAAEEAPLVLLALDLGWWRTPEDEFSIRSGVLEALSLDPARLQMNLAHTHSGPSLSREDAALSGGDLVAPYLEKLRQSCARAAQSALAAAQPATLEWRYGSCALAQERDLPDPNADRILTGFHPHAPADNTLLVGRVSNAEGEIFGVIVNYACHPITLAWQNRLLSPDFPGAMRQTLETHFPKALSLFLQGASGELAPQETFVTPDIADAQGEELGYAALSVLKGMLPPKNRLRYAGVMESGAPLAVWERETYEPPTNLEARLISVALPLQPMPSLLELDQQIAAETDRALAERLRRKRRIRKAVGEGETTQMPLWAWRIGEALFIGHPNEAYSPLQTVLRSQFASHAVIVTNVTNGHFGYLPPDALYDEDIYPVWQTPFGRGSLGIVTQVAAAALQSLTKEETPE